MRSSGRSLSVSVCDPAIRLCGGWISHSRIAAEMQRVVLAAHDLARGARHCAILFGGAVGIDAGGGVNGAGCRARGIGSGPECVVVPARADGGTEVAGRDIGGDDAGRRALHEHDVVRTRRLVQRVGQVHDAAFDRELAAERLEAGIAEIGVFNAGNAAAREGSRPPFRRRSRCRQTRPRSRRSRRPASNSSRQGICRPPRSARDGH